MSDVVMSARGLSSGYFGQPIIRNLDLDLHAGEMVGLFGANGAGKTTALLTFAGEVATISGTLELFRAKHPGSLFAAARQGVALLTDDRAIFAPLSVRDNLRLGRGGVDRALEFFPELAPFIDKRAGLLSGGQQQMLSLGRILASEPRIILADELSLGLAPLIVARLLQALQAAADGGAAVLLVEQHVPVALAAIDRACVLVRGEIRLESDAASLRDAPDRISDLYLSAEDALLEEQK
jgi:branched-chain amino acid transport system ATP-binding protein